MARRKKEDEQIEKTIRGLLKLPENKRCINCNSLGPQYVCTTFLTFVCTNCSGVHREFTHRVKSVSMAKFSLEEVSALQAGGNERARQIYLKAWDPQRHSFPDGNNLHRIRDFIKHVYVDRKYTGEKSTDTLPRLKLSDKEDSYEKKATVDRYESRNSERSSSSGRSDLKYYYDERRSPKYAKENSRSGGFKRSPIRFEVVDDRFRDDGFGSGRRSDEYRFSGVEFKMGSMSPECSKNADRSKSPVVCPVTDILGDNVPPLQVGDVTRGNEGRIAVPPLQVGDVSRGNERQISDSSANNEKEASSIGEVSVNEQPVEKQKQANSTSLIDLNADSGPSNVASVPQVEQVNPSMDVGINTTTSSKSSANTLESLLFQLTVPSVVPADNTHEGPCNSDAISVGPTGDMTTLPASRVLPNGLVGEVSQFPDANIASPTNQSSNVPTTAPIEGAPAPDSLLDKSTDSPMQPANGNTSDISFMEMSSGFSDSSIDSSTKATNAQQLPSMQQNQPPPSLAPNFGSTSEETNVAIGYPNNQESAIVSSDQLPHSTTPQTQDTISGGVQKFPPAEASFSGRKELPADLFTVSYPAMPASIPGWQNGQSHLMGFGMHYQQAMHMPAFPNPTRSTNPFDLGDRAVEGQAMPSFSMISMQGALPRVSAPTTLAHHSPYSSAIHPRSTSYGSIVSPSSYTGNQSPANPNARLEGFGIGNGVDDFGSINTDRYSAVAAPNSSSSMGGLSMGGNPFG